MAQRERSFEKSKRRYVFFDVNKRKKGKKIIGEKRYTFSQAVGHRERFPYRPFTFPQIRRSFRVFCVPLAGNKVVVPMFRASATRVRIGRLLPLVNDARRRRLSRGAVISSEVPPRRDDAALVHGAIVAPCQRAALYRLDTVYNLPLVLLQRPGIILFRSFVVSLPQAFHFFSFFFFKVSRFDLIWKGKKERIINKPTHSRIYVHCVDARRDNRNCLSC